MRMSVDLQAQGCQLPEAWAGELSQLELLVRYDIPYSYHSKLTYIRRSVSNMSVSEAD